MSDETIEALRRRIAELDQLARRLDQSGLDPRGRSFCSQQGPAMSAPLRWYDHNADNPPWLKALAEVRIQATREGWCHAHVQAIIVAIDQYAEAALGNRSYFLNKPYGVGGGRSDNVP